MVVDIIQELELMVEELLLLELLTNNKLIHIRIILITIKKLLSNSNYPTMCQLLMLLVAEKKNTLITLPILMLEVSYKILKKCCLRTMIGLIYKVLLDRLLKASMNFTQINSFKCSFYKTKFP